MSAALATMPEAAASPAPATARGRETPEHRRARDGEAEDARFAAEPATLRHDGVVCICNDDFLLAWLGRLLLIRRLSKRRQGTPAAGPPS